MIRYDIENYGVLRVLEGSKYLQDPTVKMLFDLVTIHSEALTRLVIKMDEPDNEQEL